MLFIFMTCLIAKLISKINNRASCYELESNIKYV